MVLLNLGTPSFILHVDHPHISNFHIEFGAFGDVQMKRRIMMDDVLMWLVARSSRIDRGRAMNTKNQKGKNTWIHG